MSTTRKTILKPQFNHGDRINFTSSRYLSTVKFIVVSIIVTVSALICLGIAIEGITYFTLFASLFTGTFTFIVVRYILSHTQTAALKGDTLIFSSIKKRSSVTSVRSVKNVKSSCFWGFCYTTIRYNLDGKNTFIFILTPKMNTSPEDLIHKAVKEKNKKANHKPGSVITHQA